MEFKHYNHIGDHLVWENEASSKATRKKKGGLCMIKIKKQTASISCNSTMSDRSHLHNYSTIFGGMSTWENWTPMKQHTYKFECLKIASSCTFWKCHPWNNDLKSKLKMF